MKEKKIASTIYRWIQNYKFISFLFKYPILNTPCSSTSRNVMTTKDGVTQEGLRHGICLTEG